MKRKLKKKIRRLFILVVFIGIISFCAYKFVPNLINNDKESSNTTDTTKKKNTKKDDTNYPKVEKLSLVATGDGLLHNSVYMDVYDKANDTFNFDPQLELVKEAVKGYDIVYYNQESVFGGKQTSLFTSTTYNIPGYSSYPYFNSPSEFGDAMIKAGFNMVSLASNHSTDCTSKSKDCIINSYNYWKSKDVVFDGFNPDSEHTNNYIIKEKNGIKYTMLNYTTNLNGLNGYIANDPWLIDLYDEAKVKKDIEEVKDKVDVLIVAMHWHTGAEYSFEVTQKNKEIAEYLSSLGVQVILGTYSHCLQPFDIINDGKTVVFYSLGNFISNQGVLTSSIGYKGIVGVLASLDITKTTQKDGTSEVKVDNIGADLLYTYSNLSGSVPKDFKVVPFSQMSEKYNKNYKSIYEEYSNVLTKLNKNIKIKELSN